MAGSDAVRTLAVLGAGLMGHSIAYLFARAGWHVHVQDPDQGRLDSLSERIGRIAALLGTDCSAALARIRTETRLPRAVADAQLVIEAAPEVLALKQQLFAELERHCGPDTLLASNTSAIPITQISAGIARRERVLGAHFWNPPHLVPLVEVVMMSEANRDAALALMAVLRSVAVHPVLVQRDVPGFIGNRLQHALKREAIALVASGVCDAETVDEVVRLGFGARLAVLGPLEQSDMIGLELTQKIHDVLMPDLDVTPHTHPYLTALIERGELGMRTGKGFRRWTPEQAQAVRERFERFLVQAAQQRDKFPPDRQ